MTKATVEITDKNYRITVPEAVRKQEGIGIGSIIEIDVTNLSRGKQT